MSFLKQDVISVCQEQFGQPDLNVFSPGRANIIGEHTDYTHGYVLPFATDQGIYFSAKKIAEKSLHVISLDTGETGTFVPGDSGRMDTPGWYRYLVQAIDQLGIQSLPFGLGIVIGGNLPVGAGMSSSSALTCGLLFLFNHVFQSGLSREELMEKAVKAEHGTGVRGGMMDQYTIIFGKKNKALWLDCETLQHSEVNTDAGKYGFFLINTKVKHDLADSPYNNRRDQSEEALSEIRKMEKNNELLYKHLTSAEPYANISDPVLYRRAKHIISENQRVIAMVSALQSHDVVKAGILLQESHQSLSCDYDVSCEELDFLIEKAGLFPEAWAGGRMMGGGFGGCTINLIDENLAMSVFEKVAEMYYSTFKIVPEMYRAVPSEGLRVVD